MNKSAIKNYAVWARQELMERVAQKAYTYGVTETELPAYNTDSVNGRLLSNEEKNALNELIQQIKKHTYIDKKQEVSGFHHVIEEVAYTWFNRFIALRYMEVNNFLPQRIRVFTNANNEFKPEILTDAIHIELEGLDQEKVFDYIEQASNEDLYKYLLQSICSDMHQYLPEMFTDISDYKVLLFPDNLLDENSVIGKLITDIPEEDWKDQVQIIGWLYQYYNSELKDIVMKKKNYTKDDIPAATQLFTPDWIVRYMTENSLGRIWVDGHPNFEHEQWKYYLEETEQEPEVIEQLNKIEEEHTQLKPEDIKVIDPCMGSGHILVYAFDVLMDIYRSQGYSDRDAVRSILTNNIYGLEIDERAYHLAYFSLMMKALSYDRRVLNRKIQTNLAEIMETNDALTEDVLNRLNEYKKQGQYLVDLFKEAKEYGSILNVDLSLEDIYNLENKLEELKEKEDTYNLIEQAETDALIEYMEPLVKQAKLLAQKYEAVITNPPYMGSSGMNSSLSTFVKKNYPNSKSDMSTCFMEKTISMCEPYGYMSMINIPVWMFISSYEKLRLDLLSNDTLVSMVHPGRGIFGSDFGTTTFVFQKGYIKNYKGNYRRLFDKQGEVKSVEEREKAFNDGIGKYISTQDNFSKIPGSPVAYWASSKLLSAFQAGRPLSAVAKPCVGLQTADNGRFLRLWFEVCYQNITFDAISCEDASTRATRWFSYNKGGDFRKWYGNEDFVVNWENNGYEIKNFTNEDGKLKSRPQNQQFYFKETGSWSKISSGDTAFRYYPKGFIYDCAAMGLFTKNDLFYLIGICNTKVTKKILQMISPTLNYQSGDIARLPIIDSHDDRKKIVEKLVKKLIETSKTDWDSFETSWNFTVHLLVKNHVSTISEAYSLWDKECDERFNQLKSNEEELNRIFIDIYGLQDELVPYVEDKDVTVRKADLVRDVKSLISYAVGCMFGRYSLDVEGLAYAGGEFDWNKYSSFIPDTDNVLPICDDEYFEDDIVGRFIEFVRVVYGDETLEENLTFISEALGGKGNPRDVLRNYFLNDFFKDHCNTYQVTGSGKRPIYWLFDSGKKNGFKALVYIHRYKPDLIARMRTEYIHPLQAKYRTQIDMLQNQIDSSTTTSEKVKLNKQLKKIKEQASELSTYEEKIHHWADKMEPMDLDDGVKVNYAKFQELLAKIK